MKCASSRATRVGIDIRLTSVQRGIGNYERNLLYEFARLPGDFQFFLYGDSSTPRHLIPNDSRFSFASLGPSFYPAWEQVALPRAVKQDRLDILHCPGNTAPIVPISARLVLGVMDVIFMLSNREIPKSPHISQRLQSVYYRQITQRAAKKAAHIITISNHSRDDIVSLMGISPDRITVTPLAANIPREGIASASRGSTLAHVRPYVLALGAVDPRKNGALIIRAFAQFSKSAAGRNYSLVLTGLEGKNAVPFLRMAEDLGVASRLYFPGFVEDTVLHAFYRECAMFVYPSLYEGFGLPVVEAMSFGAPVVASNRSSLPEVCGDAAILVDPTSETALYHAMEQIAGSDSLRAKLKSKGAAQASKFTWRATASATLSVYKALHRRGN